MTLWWCSLKRMDPNYMWSNLGGFGLGRFQRYHDVSLNTLRAFVHWDGLSPQGSSQPDSFTKASKQMWAINTPKDFQLDPSISVELLGPIFEDATPSTCWQRPKQNHQILWKLLRQTRLRSLEHMDPTDRESHFLGGQNLHWLILSDF